MFIYKKDKSTQSKNILIIPTNKKTNFFYFYTFLTQSKNILIIF